jgi:hypothetical protein
VGSFTSGSHCLECADQTIVCSVTALHTKNQTQVPANVGWKGSRRFFHPLNISNGTKRTRSLIHMNGKSIGKIRCGMSYIPQSPRCFLLMTVKCYLFRSNPGQTFCKSIELQTCLPWAVLRPMVYRSPRILPIMPLSGADFRRHHGVMFV